MKLFSEIKNCLTRAVCLRTPVDEAEINILGIRANLIRKTHLSVPHEFQ